MSCLQVNYDTPCHWRPVQAHNANGSNRRRLHSAVPSKKKTNAADSFRNCRYSSRTFEVNGGRCSTL